MSPELEFVYDEDAWLPRRRPEASAPSAEDAYFTSLDPAPFPLLEHEDLHDRLKKLTARQRFVIELRFGLRDGSEYSLREIAEMMNIHHSVVAEHEAAGLLRLATPTIDL